MSKDSIAGKRLSGNSRNLGEVLQHHLDEVHHIHLEPELTSHKWSHFSESLEGKVKPPAGEFTDLVCDAIHFQKEVWTLWMKEIL